MTNTHKASEYLPVFPGLVEFSEIIDINVYDSTEQKIKYKSLAIRADLIRSIKQTSHLKEYVFKDRPKNYTGSMRIYSPWVFWIPAPNAILYPSLHIHVDSSDSRTTKAYHVEGNFHALLHQINAESRVR